MAESEHRHSVLLYICIGVLIPIIATLIPYGIKYVFPEHDLNYSISSTNKIKLFTAVSIELENSGEMVEKNVSFWIKKSGFSLDTEKPYKGNYILDINPEIPYKVSEDKSYFIVAVGSLRPKEKLSLSVLSSDISSLDYDKDAIKVKSEDNIARLNTPSEFLQIVYPITFWMTVLLVVVGIVLGIYQDYFENPKKREERLLKEIDKLKR